MKTLLILSAFSFVCISAKSQTDVVADMVDLDNKHTLISLEKPINSNEFKKGFSSKKLQLIPVQESYGFASGLIENKNYSKTLPSLLDMLVEDKYNANLNFNIGLCYFNSEQNKLKCIPYFEKALKNCSVEYTGNANEKHAPIYTYYFIAQAYQLNNEFNKAQENYSIFLSYVQDYIRNADLQKEVEHKLSNCGNADYLFSKPQNIEMSLANLVNNTDMSEQNFIISKDLVFFYSTSSMNEYMTKNNLQIMSNAKGNGEISAMNNAINSEINEVPLYYASDVHDLYFSRYTKYNADIFVTRKKTNAFARKDWSEPQKLPFPINSAYNETGFYLSEDGNYAIFSSDRPGGFGGKDLYECKRNSSGNWEDAENLGIGINSAYDEDMPVFSTTDDKLYFVSNCEGSMGGFDIFYTSANDKGKWEIAKNMGYPINTTSDEISYFPFGADAFVNSNRPGGAGEYDIYLMKIK